jgi:hypothetical protein
VISNYTVSFILVVILILGFLFVAPTNVKKETLKIAGVSLNSYKQCTFSILNRYSTIFSDFNNGHIQNIVLSEKSDPKNPDLGWWGTRDHTSVFPLTGENVEIVPENSIGYKMDSTCNASTWGNNAYSYSDISSLFKSDSATITNKTYCASVYCYVSKDFDGTLVRIYIEGVVSGEIMHEYDLSRKGTWQKLDIYFNSDSDILPVNLFWAKNGVTDFTHLKGYVIFAYPEYYRTK